MNLCVIPARGGSKRLPGKNVRMFFGRPVIAYAIELANRSGLFDCVLVSTDDNKITKVARDWGAGIHRRSPETATDEATDYDVIKEILKSEQCDYLCYLYPITPLLRSWVLIDGFLVAISAHRAVHGADAYGKDVGAFYWVDSRAFRDMTKEQYYDWCHLTLAPLEYQDVNTEEDWQLLKAKYVAKWMGV